MLGTIVNSLLIIIGTFIGILFKKLIKEEMQDILMKAMGLCVLFIAITSFDSNASVMNILLSLALGTILGEMLKLDEKINELGDYLQSKVKSTTSISAGFVHASLLFCVGSMAIIGAFEGGLTGNHEMLITKGVIDGLCAILFASQYGIGVAFSGILVFIYEGALALGASYLAAVFNDTIILQMSCVGNLILVSVALNMMKIGKFKSMNYVPAIFISILLSFLFQI